MHYLLNSYFASARCAALSLAIAAALSFGACVCFAQVDKLTSESELIAILADGDAPRADKAMACKRLTVYGSAAAIPELAKLLSDPELASWTRIALEAIPGSEADAALRTACESLSGNLLIGAINSIGVRADRAAVEMLVAQLQADDPQVAVAAAYALGKIADAGANTALRAAMATEQPQLRSAVAAACVLCAERALQAGDAELAAEICDQVRQADVPQQRIVEATRGAIMARGEKGIPLLIESLHSPEKKLFHVALQTARELPSQQLASALLAEVASASPDRAPLIVQALADMPGTVDVQTIVELAANAKSKEVRVAAIDAIGRTGNASCVAPLLKVATESEDLIAAVKAALVNIPDEAANREIVSRLPEAQGSVDAQLLIEVVGLRRIEATDALVKALDSPRPEVRHAALESLGRTVAPQRLGLLISQVVSPKHDEDSAAAVTALKTAAVRMPDREATAAELTAAMQDASPAVQVSFLEILGSMGGPQALQTLAKYAGGDNVELQDVSSRLLGGWMTADAAPVLLKLATTGPADKFQVRAMSGYIRIARQFVMSDEERVAMCVAAMQACKRDNERKMVLDVLQRYPTRGTLQIALNATGADGIRAEAEAAAKKIGEKLKDDDEAQALLKKAGL